MAHASARTTVAYVFAACWMFMADWPIASIHLLLDVLSLPTAAHSAERTIAAPSFYVDSNSALKAFSPDRATIVRRRGFYAPDDGGDAVYKWSSSPCPLNQGAGDDGSQVRPDAGSGCWIAELRGPYQSVQVWGAKCDGRTDDMRPIASAWSVASITSLGRTCAVSGNVQIPDGGKAENLRLRQIANNRGAIIRTFSKSSGTGPILLHKVSVDRNGEASGCVVSKCAGIWIANVDEVTLEDVEVFGNGRGVGIAVTDATNVVLRDIYVHDMHWSALEDPNTEQIVGVWPIRVNGLVAYHVRVSNLQGRIDEGALLPYQTDCFDFSAVSGAVVVGSELSTCGEGVDISSAGNQKIWLIDTRYRDIDSWPEKWGSASHSGSIGSQSKNSGLGFVIYSQPNLPATTSIHIYDAVAANVGFNHRWPNQAGFRVIARSKGAVVPLDSQCIRCSAIDSGRTMAFGFMVDPGASLRMVQSRAEGFTRAYAHIAGYEVSKSELK